MPDAVPRTRFQTINATPMRDLLCGRITARLDWRHRLVAAGMPADVSSLITRTVRRTRLWRLEKAAVADELIAHFTDALAAGATDAVSVFGDEPAAAKLIRRAKRRNRPLLWKIWMISFCVVGVLAALYAMLLVRFCVEHPTVKVNYIARMNEPVLATPLNDRAWPLWRQGILALSDPVKDKELVFSTAFDFDNGRSTWQDVVRWLNTHAAGVSLLRQAARKPVLGFIYGAGGSTDDPAVFPSQAGRQTSAEPAIAVLLPHLNYLRFTALVLSYDAKRAADAGDAATADVDLSSMQSLARQLRNSDGVLVTQLVALGIDDLAVGRLQTILVKHPGLFGDDPLIRFAHQLAGPRVAADLVGNFDFEQNVFDDVVQRAFTDDGCGGGHMTLQGQHVVFMMSAIEGADKTSNEDAYTLRSTLPLATVSRSELTDAEQQWMARRHADLAVPLHTIDFARVQAEVDQIHSPGVVRRFGPLVEFLPNLLHVQSECEKYLGQRDGTLVAIALEMFHRRHGCYPQVLAELTPQLLPAVPADRITGDPVRYRLIDGKPVVYSVGADRVDDGGHPRLNGHNATAAVWGETAVNEPRGDWVLYPPNDIDE